MNERIEKLYVQSFVTDIYANVGPNDAELGIRFDPEKFAELIVRECADVCFRIDGEYDGEEVLATWCGDGILKHFGVEE